MTLAKRNSPVRWITVASIVVFAGIRFSVAAKEQPTVEELKARVISASIGERTKLCLEVAERQLDAAEKLFTATDDEKAQAALTDVATFSEQARDYALESGKHQKQTEISVRKMVRKLTELKHTVTHDNQTAVQSAVDRLERVRDDLLAAMFHKKGEK
jgi:hypothetical protein